MSSEGDTAKNPPLEPKEKSEESSQNSKEKTNAKEAENENNVDPPPVAPVDKKADEKDDKSEVKAKPEENDKAAEKSEKPEDNKSEAKAKPEVAKKDEEESADTAKDTEESEDDEGSEKGDSKVPLLDQPLEKSGKRDRKNVQRFNEEPTVAESKENATKADANGVGCSLGSIPRVDACISRFKNDDMKLLHRLLYDTPGKNATIKKNIRKFNGFGFKKASEEYDKKLAAIQKCEVKHLKSICEMLDLQKTGVKDEIVERIMEFLLEPKDSGKAVTGAGGRPKRTAAVRANNRGYSSHDNYSSDERHSGGRSSRDKGRRANLKDDSSSHSDEDFEPSDEEEDEKPRVTNKRKSVRKKYDSDDEEISDVDSPTSEDSDFQEEQKNKRKKVAKVNTSVTKGRGGRRGRPPASAAKKPTRGRKRIKESSEEEEDESDHKEEEGSSSEDEPLVKKAKAAEPPTDDEIKSYVKEILDGANLEQITMKTVCQQVYAHYPDFDLAHKKDFIKTTVKSLIST